MERTESVQLRKLAATYADYAQGATMAARREKWRSHNQQESKTCPFHIEDNGSFLKDLTPELKCSSNEGRWLEARLLRAIVAYEKIDDDRIIPDRFVVDWITPITSFCPELTFVRAADGRGGSLGYESNKPIKDIDRDFGKLKRRTLTLEKEKTFALAEFAAEIFKGLLPVVVGRPSSYYSDGFANKAVHLMGMEELFLEMAENPDSVHRLFTHLVEDNLALGAWEEEQGLLIANDDGNQGYCSGSSQYSVGISGDNRDSAGPMRSVDRWGYLEAQEATGISPDMFAEFFMPHMAKLSQKFSRLKFGCCEPVHHLMPHLQKMPGLHKVSVTPWCDQEKLAAGCRKDIIWSRKPVPLKLCGTAFDPVDFRNHLVETLEIGKDFFVEFVFRDTTCLTGAMSERVAAACNIVRDVTGHPEGGRNFRL